MVRGKDACWEHCVLVDAPRQKVRCNYCQREFSGGVYRMKFHLAQIKNKDIIPCTQVPINVRDHILTVLTTSKKQKTPKKVVMHDNKMGLLLANNGEENSSSTASGESSGQNGSTCPSSLFPAVDHARRQKYDRADNKIALFFFHNSILFNATKSIYYQEMVNAIADCGVGYKAPSYDKMRSSLLEKVKGEINESYNKLKLQWKETGCTILCDRTKSYVVFSVACQKGALFLKSVDVSGREDDSTYLFELIESIVLEVGLENVVQVITDGTASYVYAGRMLMAKYSSIFWSPCASYCIEKMLEDISKQERVGIALEEAKSITRFIYSHSWALTMMRKFTGGKELIRPRITRFVTNFLSLRSIIIMEENLKHMFSHGEWVSSMCSKNLDAQSVKSLINSERFWKYANEAVAISEPLIKVMRIVDGDMPAMGYIYEGMERVKGLIKAYYKGIEENFIPIWEIIDRRWNILLHSSLHSASAFLNPSIFYSTYAKIDLRMRNGFQEAMAKMATTEKDKIGITKEHPVYINAQGALGTEFAIMGRTLNSPGDWWAGYGYEIPTLQRAAIRILSQPCSSHLCRWNWNTFDSLHTRKRTEPDLKKFNDLVFVHCNLWLRAIYQSQDGKCNPVVFDQIDVGSEWPSEFESPAPLLDDSWFD